MYVYGSRDESFVPLARTPLMFGSLLSRVPDPFTLMGAFHFLYIVMIALSVVCSILGIMAGLALLGDRVGPPARAY